MGETFELSSSGTTSDRGLSLSCSVPFGTVRIATLHLFYMITGRSTGQRANAMYNGRLAPI